MFNGYEFGDGVPPCLTDEMAVVFFEPRSYSESDGEAISPSVTEPR